jgi:mRNA interferase MazF
MRRGEIWLAEFGIPYGSEAGYTRPVLIVQDDSFNESRIKTIVVLPMTTNLRLSDAPGNVFIRKRESKLMNDSVIIAAQRHYAAFPPISIWSCKYSGAKSTPLSQHKV